MCINKYKKYRIYASLAEHFSDGFILVNNAPWERRTTVWVKAKGRGNIHGVFCEALKLDKYLRDAYNDRNKTKKIEDHKDAIIVSEWYRHKLGIKTKADFEITVREIIWPFSAIGKAVACLQTPMVGIRVATWLAIISIVIGIIGLFPALSSKNSAEHAEQKSSMKNLEKLSSDNRKIIDEYTNRIIITQKVENEIIRQLKDVNASIKKYHQEVSNILEIHKEDKKKQTKNK